MKTGNVPILVCVGVTKLLLVTDGTTNARSQDVAIPGIEDLGAYINSVTVHAQTDDPTTDFRWQVVFWWSYDGRTWSTPVTVGSAMGSSAVPTIQTPYTTATTFGLKMRWGVACWNANAGSMQRGIVSFSMVFELKS